MAVPEIDELFVIMKSTFSRTRLCLTKGDKLVQIINPEAKIKPSNVRVLCAERNIRLKSLFNAFDCKK